MEGFVKMRYGIGLTEPKKEIPMPSCNPDVGEYNLVPRTDECCVAEEYDDTYNTCEEHLVEIENIFLCRTSCPYYQKPSVLSVNFTGMFGKNEYLCECGSALKQKLNLLTCDKCNNRYFIYTKNIIVKKVK